MGDSMTSLQTLFYCMKKEHEQGFIDLKNTLEGANLTITIECAYCGAHIGTKKGGKVGGISHGICEYCKPIVMAQIDAVTIEEQARVRALLQLRYDLKETRQNGLKITFTP